MPLAAPLTCRLSRLASSTPPDLLPTFAPIIFVVA
jgi:hypothetical protein